MRKVHLSIDGVSACGAGSSTRRDVRLVTCQRRNCRLWMLPRSLDWQQIGPYEYFSFVVGSSKDYPTQDTRIANWNGLKPLVLIGLVLAHLTEDGHPCGGGAYWVASRNDPDPTLWTLVDLEPLHLEPSLLHKRPDGCGHHGFIRDGKWEDVGRQAAVE